jgi:luciferase family oxidoreductase group 1
MQLSVLDLVPVRTDQSTSDALAATVRLAQTADRLGYTRYWVAEHHNMPAVAENFPNYLDDVVALMSPHGARVAIPRQRYILKATPAAASEPRLWLLGSSMYSAHLAAAKGLPYVFAHHFSGQGTEEALAAYRSEFVPSGLAPEPVTFLTVNAVVAPTREEAQALLLPNLQMMARLRTGQPLGPLELVEDAQTAELTAQEQAIVEAGRQRAVVGTPSEAADQVRALAGRFGVDEVMVAPVASARRGTDPATAPARDATLELLAKELF